MFLRGPVGVQLELRDPPSQLLEGDTQLELRQRRAHTSVRTQAERDMRLGTRVDEAVENYLVGA